MAPDNTRCCRDPLLSGSVHPSFGPPARDIATPNTFGVITSTISSPRVVELGLKFYF
jgi:hypothetical protein